MIVDGDELIPSEGDVYDSAFDLYGIVFVITAEDSVSITAFDSYVIVFVRIEEKIFVFVIIAEDSVLSLYNDRSYTYC